MRLTTKGRFAVTAMVELAIQQARAPVALAEISQRQRISLSYLEQLFNKLRRLNLVKSVRGPGGGYALARQAEQITVADIMIAVNEPLDATRCGGRGNCGRSVNGEQTTCMTHDLWTALNQKMIEYLGSVSLKNLAEQQTQRAVPQRSRGSAQPQVALAHIPITIKQAPKTLEHL
jgi:Rrf2 family transcriptional regulator, iron-sulfur cluster assembly transcription factor